MSLTIDTKRTAILALDFENDIVNSTEGVEPVLDNAVQVVDAGREVHAPVVFVKVGFDAKYRDTPRNSPLFQMVKKKGILRAGTPGTEIHAMLRPLPDEPVIHKTCINPFLSSNLQQRLQGLGVDTLIVMGLWTNYVVESTVRHASDMGYRVIVVKDACASNTVENHEFTINNILPTLALVHSAEEVLQALGVEPRPFRKNTLYAEAELDARGASVQRVVVKPGGRVDSHTHHKTTEVYCVVRGSAKLAIGDKEYVATPGKVFMARPGERHSVQAVGDDDFELVMFTTNQEPTDVYVG